MGRRTVVVHGRLAAREHKLAAARGQSNGLQVMTFEHLAVRIAGGFARPIDSEALRIALQEVLPNTDVGELEAIKLLPGMISAAADTLHKVWRAGIDLAASAGEHPRLDAMYRLEAAVLAALPAGMMRPADIVARAMPRLAHASSVLGAVTIEGITELSPCWRAFLAELAKHTPVTWNAGPRSVPAWLAGTEVKIATDTPHHPALNATSSATSYHEAIEAMRWARELIASGRALPHEVAIASASPADYDEHFLSLRADANLNLHFVHGVKVTSTRDGQAAAALADILVRGLSQTRVRRLAALCSAAGPFQQLAVGWTRILPEEAPLTSLEAWERLFATVGPDSWPDGADQAAILMPLLALLSEGVTVASAAGEGTLSGRALAIWRKALAAGPAAAIDATIAGLREDDAIDGCVNVTWMPASALAASPRPFVRLLGLNSSRWPRGVSDDRLIPDHVIPTRELAPLPIDAADRRDFDTIMVTTKSELSLSRSRRDHDGRLLGRSVLLPSDLDETYLRRTRVPSHCFSETDRLTARAGDFAKTDQATSAVACWVDWHRTDITAHDGLIRPDHPLIQAALNRTQSASSLRLLLRNPLGFVWKYALRFREPMSSADPLVVDARGLGNLLHEVLDLTLRKLEGTVGVAKATEAQLLAAVTEATEEVASSWENTQAVPPGVIWRRTLQDIEALSVASLDYPEQPLQGSRSYSEVPFGGTKPKSDGALPWASDTEVRVPGTRFKIAGYIDRVDLAGDNAAARVRDYKSGKRPKDEIVLDGGSELQRCLYAFTVKALLGDEVDIDASLLYPRDGVALTLADPEQSLIDLGGYLKSAEINLAAGRALIGPDSAGSFDDLRLAMPANADVTYCKRKSAKAAELLGDATEVWEAI